MPPTTRNRKRAGSNVEQGVTTKKARKAKQPASDDPDLVDGDQVSKGGNKKEKQGGRGKARGGKVVKARGKAGRYVLPMNLLSFNDSLAEKHQHRRMRKWQKQSPLIHSPRTCFSCFSYPPWLS